MTTTVDTARPADAESCARALAEASAAKRTVRVRGSGKKEYIGGGLAPADVVLETTAMVIAEMSTFLSAR